MLIILDGIVRDIISDYPMTVAVGQMLSYMDAAMDNVLNDRNFDPSNIDKVIYGADGRALSIETDTTLISYIKTAYVQEVNRLIKALGGYMDVSVPLGTLIGHEYTLGRGPKIPFRLQFSCTLTAEPQSNFYESGVNNTLHSIELVVTNTIFIVIPWGNNSKTVNTKYILSETVIVGQTPEAFTNVYGACDEITDDIFDHGAEIK